jgi:uncharacterized protein (TIGR02001 family)
MNTSKLACGLLFVLSSLSTAAYAQEEEAASPLSGSIAVTSDYVFRGASQTQEDPAFQAGLTYTFPLGIYVGVWGSNVDFGPGDPDWEVDGFIGYNVDLTKNLNLDMMFNRYNYPSAGGSNFNELIYKLTYKEAYSLTVAYTADVYGLEENSFYYSLGGSWSLPYDLSLGAHVGYTTFASALEEVYEDYTDYGVSLGKTFGPLDVTLSYTDTDSSGEYNFGKDLADGRFFVTATVSF